MSVGMNEQDADTVSPRLSPMQRATTKALTPRDCEVAMTPCSETNQPPRVRYRAPERVEESSPRERFAAWVVAGLHPSWTPAGRGRPRQGRPNPDPRWASVVSDVPQFSRGTRGAP